MFCGTGAHVLVNRDVRSLGALTAWVARYAPLNQDMNSIGYLTVANLFFAGLLAGAEIAVHYGTIIPHHLLTDTAQLQIRQSMTQRLRVLMPLLFLPSLMTAALLMRLHRVGREVELRGAAIALLVVWIATGGGATVRINGAPLEGERGAPPEGWKKLVARAERFHMAGVWAAVIAFLLLLSVTLTSRG